MIDPSRIQFPKVNKTFLKGFFWLLVFLFLASVFSSARGIYDRFLRKPEVRKDVVQLGQDVRLGNQLWIQRAIIIHNRGNDDARNVQIKCLFPNGMITRIIVISEEEYSEISDSNSTKSCTYSLPRLAAGSKFSLLLWVTSSSMIPNYPPKAIDPIVSASFDGGVAVSSDKPTALEEVQGIWLIINNGLRAIIRRFDAKIQPGLVIQHLTLSLLPLWGIHVYNNTNLDNREINSAFVSVLLLMATAWLLLSRIWAGLFIALLFSLFVWLFFDVYLDTIWLLIPCILGLIALGNTGSIREAIILSSGLVVMFAILLLNMTMVDWDCIRLNTFWTIQMFTCFQSNIHGGVWLGCLLFATYLIIIEL